MNSDLMYTYLIDSTWFFLGSWVLLLLGAGVIAFRQDWPEKQGRPALPKAGR